jgi:hypothetical protein
MVAITGGVVLRQKGSSVTFRPKCEKCGNAENIESTLTLMKGVTEIATHKCSCCGSNLVTKMKLSDD